MITSKIDQSLLEFYSEQYDVDVFLKKYSELLFGLDKETRRILGVISKNEGKNQKEIFDLCFNENKGFTRDQVKHRLTSKKNAKNLIRSGYVMSRTKGNIGNIKSKKEKQYYLTLKGLLASLSSVPLHENYMMKYFLEFLQTYTKKNEITKIALELIKYNLAMFFIKCVLTGLKLFYINKPHELLSSLNYGDDHLLYSQYPVTIRNLSIEDVIHIRSKFHIFSVVLREMLDELWKEKLASAVPSERKELHDKESWMKYQPILNLVKGWYAQVSYNQFGRIRDSPSFKTEDAQITIDSIVVNVAAKRMLKNLEIKSNFSLDDDPLFLNQIDY